MTAVTFTLDGLGPFDGEYHDEGKHLSEVRRLTFKTPKGFSQDSLKLSQLQIYHPDGTSIHGNAASFSLHLDGESYIEFTPK